MIGVKEKCSIYCKAEQGIQMANAQKGLSGGASEEPTCQWGDIEMQIWCLGWEDPLEEGMAAHS